MDPYLLYLLTGIPSSHPDFNQTPPFLSSKELIVPSTPERQTVSRNSQMTYLPHNPLQHPLNTVEPKQVVTTDGVLSETIFNGEIILPHSSVDESSIRPRIQNVVSTVDLECKLDLNRIAEKARNAEYNPKRFSAVVMRIREPKSTALIFNSGKIVCLGTKSEESAKLASRKFARILQKMGYKVKFGEFKVQNMVGSCDVKFQIRLELLSISLRKFSHFEPEVFPGLVCKMIDPKVTILIFASGKVVITGAKKADDTMEAFQKIYSVVKHFKKA